MNRLCIATRGIGSWKQRLVNPARQWKRGFSAFETAVSWEIASNSQSGFHTASGMPAPLENLFFGSNYTAPILTFAVAEHKVDLPGGNAASQCDVWALVNTSSGMLSLTVEAKAMEPFGDETLQNWLAAGKTARSKKNRSDRWQYVQSHLPISKTFPSVRYQMLHRCAASVIEATRYGFQHAVFVVQAFDAPAKSFQDYAVFCQALNIPAVRGKLQTTSVNGVSLSIGWADCLLATDRQVAAVK